MHAVPAMMAVDALAVGIVLLLAGCDAATPESRLRARPYRRCALPACALAQVLGVPSTAGADEIRRMYRQLALRWHPDKNPGNEEEAARQFK